MSACSPATTNYSDNECSSPVYNSSNAPPTPEPEADELKARQVKPTPKKQYQCTQCLKNFSRPSALQTHSYTHTAEKPFQCQNPNCGRRFSVVSNLRRHFKVHQKPSVGNKLSSEDRLRCVKQLMKRSDALLSNKQSESTVLVDQQQHHRYQHYLILPSITNNTFVPISPSIQPTTAPGDINNNSFLNSSAMVDLPLYWPSNPSVYDDSRERQYLTPSKVFPSAESFFSNYHQY